MTLIYGSHVDFKASMILEPKPNVTFNYAVQLLFNRKEYGKFVYTILPLQPPATGSAGMEMTWPVKITGPKHATATLRIVVTSLTPTQETTQQDTVHQYRVVCDPKSCRLLRFFERRFGRCE